MSLLYYKICDMDLSRLSFTHSYTKCCIYIWRKSLNFIILRCLKSGDEASLYFAPVMAGLIGYNVPLARLSGGHLGLRPTAQMSPGHLGKLSRTG